MFWTLNDEFGPVTLCEEHALLAVNQGLLDVAPDTVPFGSVTEFLVVTEAYAIANGCEGMQITGSNKGACGACKGIAA